MRHERAGCGNAAIVDLADIAAAEDQAGGCDIDSRRRLAGDAVIAGIGA